MADNPFDQFMGNQGGEIIQFPGGPFRGPLSAGGGAARGGPPAEVVPNREFQINRDLKQQYGTIDVNKIEQQQTQERLADQYRKEADRAALRNAWAQNALRARTLYQNDVITAMQRAEEELAKPGAEFSGRIAKSYQDQANFARERIALIEYNLGIKPTTPIGQQAQAIRAKLAPGSSRPLQNLSGDEMDFLVSHPNLFEKGDPSASSP